MVHCRTLGECGWHMSLDVTLLGKTSAPLNAPSVLICVDNVQSPLGQGVRHFRRLAITSESTPIAPKKSSPTASSMQRQALEHISRTAHAKLDTTATPTKRLRISVFRGDFSVIVLGWGSRM